MLSRILRATLTTVETKSRCQKFHTTCIKRSLDEFFDDPKNFGADSVKVGRQWLKDELRIKSNEDLHKLWYILLKERNMLLTMEHNYKEEVLAMPNQERIDKVEESMDNLETVVRERNRAFYELETGESGERERIIRSGPFGIDVGYVKQEHTLPRKYNIPYRKMLRYRYHTSWGPEVREFHARYLELRRKEEWNERMTQMRKASWILKRFPDSDEDAIKEKYPLADINAVKRWYKIKGHHSNQQFNV